MTTSKISPLRQRMIEDMKARQLGGHSQRSHIYSCKRFAAANAEAVKTLPVLKLIGSHHEFIPPYIQDSKAALTLWKVVEVPLSELDRDRATQGMYGPAAARILGFS